MTAIFNTSWEYPMMHVWWKFGHSTSNLMSYHADKVKLTNGQTQAMTIPLRPERWRGKKAVYISIEGLWEWRLTALAGTTVLVLCQVVKSLLLISRSGDCFTNVSRALKNILSKFVYCRNRTSYENFKLKLCSCAQSHALGTRTKFQLEILAINVITGIAYFRKIILESSRNVSETTPRHPKMKSTDAQSSNELQQLDLYVGYQDNSPSNGHQGNIYFNYDFKFLFYVCNLQTV